MKKVLVFAILFFSLVVSVSAVNLNGTININSCQAISSPGNYTLITNLSSSTRCIEIKSDNVSFNGNGYKISGLGGVRDYGIFVDSQKNVGIRNAVVENFDSGIKIVSCLNCQIENNIVRNSTYGIILTTSRNSKITNNTVEYNSYGIKLATSSFDSTSSNIITNNTYGVYLGVNSYYNEFDADKITGNTYGISLKSSSNNNFRNGLIWGSKEQEIVLDFGSTGNSFVNMSYNANKQDIEAGSNLMRIGDLETDVIESAQNPIENASVYVFNGDGRTIFDGDTNENGSVTTELLDYTDNGRRKIYEDLYLVSASKENYTSNNSFVDINNNTRVFLTITNIPSNSSDGSGLVFGVKTTPQLPFENNGEQQIMQMWFNSSNFPLNVSVTLKNDGFAKREDYYVNGTDGLPISFTIPSGLENGNYSFMLEASNSNGSIQSMNLGRISVVRAQASAPTGGSGGGGGGGGSSGRGASSISFNTNQSSNASGGNAFDNNTYGNFSDYSDNSNNEDNNQGGFSALTGAVIGALKRNVWLVAAFIAALAIAFFVLSNKKKIDEGKKPENGKKANGKNGNGKAV